MGYFISCIFVFLGFLQMHGNNSVVSKHKFVSRYIQWFDFRLVTDSVPIIFLATDMSVSDQSVVLFTLLFRCQSFLFHGFPV